jgi:hypothetical protein
LRFIDADRRLDALPAGGPRRTPRYANAFAKGGGITFRTVDGCLPIPGVTLYARGGGCGPTWDAAYRWAETAGFKRIVIVSDWPSYFEPAPGRPSGITCLERAGGCAGPAQFAAPADLARAEFALLADEIQRLQQRGAEVVLVGATPWADAGAPRSLYHLTFWTHSLSPAQTARAAVEARTQLAMDRLQWVSGQTGAVLINPLDWLCDRQSCRSTQDGRSLYKDMGHFRASMMSSPQLSYLDPWLAPAASTPAPTRLK